MRSWFSRRRRSSLAAALALVLLGAAWPVLHRAAAAPSPGEVRISGFAFAPAVLTVPRGTTVTWINQDDEPHTVTSERDPKAFASQALDTDESFTFTFRDPGTYRYFCSIHPHMQGTIVVQ
ncbi:MAG TPA: cupredoxin family copper-binding protein [Stellaceae bacterium]|nr:cupredoxin family copper-binding protein [Stellaceae bacterium]